MLTLKHCGMIKGVDYPAWGSEKYLTYIKSALYRGETPQKLYKRLADKAASYYKGIYTPEQFEEILWKGWLIPASPVSSNFGTPQGLPISCFSGQIGDDMYEIGRKETEVRMLSKYGGGTAMDFSLIRPAGSPVGTNGAVSDGVIPFMRSYEATVESSKQLGVRRGSIAFYLSAEHPDYMDFLHAKKNVGEANRLLKIASTGAVFSDAIMERIEKGDEEARKIWDATLISRIETGYPYIFFEGNANRNLPSNWKDHGLNVKHSNLCSEIMLPTGPDLSLVCCLSSLNLAKYDEWKDTNTVELAVAFLDSVIEEFLEKGKNTQGIEDAITFAEKSRAIGLGTMGYHTYLQSKNLPFNSISSKYINKQIFSSISKQANEASAKLAAILGEPEWMAGTGQRNLTKMAIAPNLSSAKIAPIDEETEGVSQGIEPLTANVFIDGGAKGSFASKNRMLEKVLREIGRDTPEVWEQIRENKGSVMGLDFLDKETKDVFLTAREINQLAIIEQAADRQVFIDQGQSLNLFFDKQHLENMPGVAKFYNEVHLQAYRLGVKALYYLHTGSVLKVSTTLAESQQELQIDKAMYSNCTACEG